MGKPDTGTREARAYVEAQKQSLQLSKVGEGWSISGSSGPITMLGGGLDRLPDGREVPRTMTLDEVEDFLEIDYTVD